MWLATLNTSRTVLTTKDNKNDDSYIARLLLQISAAGGMQKGTNGDESCLLRQEQMPIHVLFKFSALDYQTLTYPKKATNSQTLTENFQGWCPCLCKGTSFHTDAPLVPYEETDAGKLRGPF